MSLTGSGNARSQFIDINRPSIPMRYQLIAYFILSGAALAATDYKDITTFTGPCAWELAAMAKDGDINSARDQVRVLCRSETSKTCPDLWLVYAYCEIKLLEPDAVAVSKDAIRHLPGSAAAHLLHGLAIGLDGGAGGLIRMLRQLGPTREAMEMAVKLDPDCHPARSVLVDLYGMHKLIGGDAAKQKYHLAELDRRDPYFSALAHGALEADKKNYTAAAAYYHEAQRLQPEKTEAPRQLIRLSAAKGDFDEAFAACLAIKPKYPGDCTADDIFITLSVKSGLRTDEALAASKHYLETARRVTPLERAGAMVNTAILLKSLGRYEESAQMVAKAESLWAGATKMFQVQVEDFPGKRPVVAKR